MCVGGGGGGVAGWGGGGYLLWNGKDVPSIKVYPRSVLLKMGFPTSIENVFSKI